MVPSDVEKEIEDSSDNEVSLRVKSRCEFLPGVGNKNERMQFIIKVYGILITQLGITVAFTLFTMLNERTREFMKEYK